MTIRLARSKMLRLNPRRQSGQALVAALMILIYLTSLLGAMSAGLLVEAELAMQQSRRLAAYYAARAGTEAAVRRLLLDDPEVDTLADGWSHNPAEFEKVPLDEGQYEVRYRPAPGEPFVPGVLDEERKLNVNEASGEMLARLDSFFPPQMAQAVLDRRAREPFRSLAELADSGIMDWSAVGNDGRLASLLTVYGDGRVNVNTAPPTVLACLPGVSREAADAFAAWRDENRSENFAETSQEAADRLGVSQEARPDFLRRSKVSSTQFTITSVGRLPGGAPTVQEIRLTVQRDAAGAKVVAFEQLR